MRSEKELVLFDVLMNEILCESGIPVQRSHPCVRWVLPLSGRKDFNFQRSGV